MPISRVLALLSGFLLHHQSLAAVEWNIEPALAVSGTFTDNLELDSAGQEADEFVTEFVPSISIDANGDRFSTEFEYRLQALRYSDRDEFDEVLDYSRITGNAKLIGESLGVDFSGNLNQQTIDPSRSSSISGITRSGNRGEAGVYTVSPYWKRQIGKTSSIVAGYRFGAVEYENPTLADSKNNGVYADISGAPPREPWSWNISFNNTRIDYDTGSEVELQRAGAELTWTFNRNFSLFIGGGDEDNRFDRLAGPAKIDGSFWDIGLRGELDKLTSYSISAGQQHFGDSFGFSLKRKAGKLTTDISYIEETTTPGAQQLQYVALFQFLTDITGVELPTPGAQVYVRKRLSAVARLELARTSVNFNAYDEQRDYLTSQFGESDGITGVAFSFTWQARPRTNISLDAGWQRIDPRNSLEDPEDVRLQVRLQQDVSDTVSLNLRAWRNSRFATTPDREYEANAVSLGIRKAF